ELPLFPGMKHLTVIGPLGLRKEPAGPGGQQSAGKEEILTSIPFARPQDAGPSVAVVTKVNRIQDQLVKKHDIELHMHLNRLEIAPQIYGMSVTTPSACS
ncbi:hypothetical protein XENOCAPTIV_009464, partial [Xenoophorus captivus]